jgi:hypothetical protein
MTNDEKGANIQEDIQGNHPPIVWYETARRVMDADGAMCRDCEAVFSLYSEGPFWGWRKSQGLHERGMGHKMALFRVVKMERANG